MSLQEPGQGQFQGQGQHTDHVFSPKHRLDLHDPVMKDTDSEGRFQFDHQTEHNGALRPEPTGDIPPLPPGNPILLPRTSSPSATVDPLPLPGSSQLSALANTLSLPLNSADPLPLLGSSQPSDPKKDPFPWSVYQKADPFSRPRSFQHSPEVNSLVHSAQQDSFSLQNYNNNPKGLLTRSVNDHNYHDYDGHAIFGDAEKEFRRTDGGGQEIIQHDAIDENNNDNYNLEDSGPILSTGYDNELRNNHGFKIKDNHGFKNDDYGFEIEDNHGFKNDDKSFKIDDNHGYKNDDYGFKMEDNHGYKNDDYGFKMEDNHGFKNDDYGFKIEENLDFKIEDSHGFKNNDYGFKIEDKHDHKFKSAVFNKNKYDFEINPELNHLHGSDDFDGFKNPFHVKNSAEWDRFFSSILSRVKKHQNQHFPPDVSDVSQQSHDLSRDFMAGNSRSQSADQRPTIGETKYKFNKEFPKINNFSPYPENSLYVDKKYDNESFPVEKKGKTFDHGGNSKFVTNDEPNKFYFDDNISPKNSIKSFIKNVDRVIQSEAKNSPHDHLDKFINENNISLNSFNDKYTFDNKINKYFKLPWSTFKNYKKSISPFSSNDIFIDDNLYSRDVPLSDQPHTKKLFQDQKSFNLNNSQILNMNNKNLNFSNLFNNHKRIEVGDDLKISISKKSSNNNNKLNNSKNYFARIFWNPKYFIDDHAHKSHDQPEKYLNRHKRYVNNGKITGKYLMTRDGELLSGKHAAHLRVNSPLQLSHRRRPGPRQHSRVRPKHREELMQLLQPPEVGHNLLSAKWPNVENIRNKRTIIKHNYHKNISETKYKVNNNNFIDERNVLTVKGIKAKTTKIKGKFEQNLLNVTHNMKNNVSTNKSTSGQKLTEGRPLRLSRAFFTLGTRGNHGHLYRKDGQHGSTPNYLNDYPDPDLQPRPPPSPPMNPKDTHGPNEAYFPAEGDSHKYPPPEGDFSHTVPVSGSISHALSPPSAEGYHKPYYSVPARHGKYLVYHFGYC